MDGKCTGQMMDGLTDVWDGGMAGRVGEWDACIHEWMGWMEWMGEWGGTLMYMGEMDGWDE